MTAVRLIGVRRNPGEINDRRLEEIRETEFGLPPSNHEGRFGNGAPFAFLQSAQKRSSRKPPNPLRSARGSATFCAASPRTQAGAREDSRGSGDSRRPSARAAPMARARIQLATSTSSAPVEIKSRKAADSRPVAAKNRRSHRTVLMIGARSAE